jgi:hypothetical protein
MPAPELRLRACPHRMPQGTAIGEQELLGQTCLLGLQLLPLFQTVLPVQGLDGPVIGECSLMTGQPARASHTPFLLVLRVSSRQRQTELSLILGTQHIGGRLGLKAWSDLNPNSSDH